MSRPEWWKTSEQWTGKNVEGDDRDLLVGITPTFACSYWGKSQKTEWLVSSFDCKTRWWVNSSRGPNMQSCKLQSSLFWWFSVIYWFTYDGVYTCRYGSTHA
jgi:hypothetical protein